MTNAMRRSMPSEHMSPHPPDGSRQLPGNAEGREAAGVTRASNVMLVSRSGTVHRTKADAMAAEHD